MSDRVKVCLAAVATGLLVAWLLLDGTQAVLLSDARPVLLVAGLVLAVFTAVRGLVKRSPREPHGDRDQESGAGPASESGDPTRRRSVY